MREDSWLAERFGRPVFTVGDDPPAEVADHARKHRPAFYQAKVPTSSPGTVGALEAIGFRVVDVNVTLSRRPGSPVGGFADADGAATTVVEAQPQHHDDLLEIAATDYRVSRFHLDPDIPDSLASGIKRDWIEAYLTGARGQQLLVAENGEGQAVGFLAVLAHEPDGTPVRVIDLIAVRSNVRSRGSGASLVRKLIADSDGIYERVDVGTQIANVGALRFYARLGFEVRDTRYVLHLHSTASTRPE